MLLWNHMEVFPIGIGSDFSWMEVTDPKKKKVIFAEAMHCPLLLGYSANIWANFATLISSQNSGAQLRLSGEGQARSEVKIHLVLRVHTPSPLLTPRSRHLQSWKPPSAPNRLKTRCSPSEMSTLHWFLGAATFLFPSAASLRYSTAVATVMKASFYQFHKRKMFSTGKVGVNNKHRLTLNSIS